MIDLHIHSKYSEDREFTPSECAEKGISYIPGIEIDCTG